MHVNKVIDVLATTHYMMKRPDFLMISSSFVVMNAGTVIIRRPPWSIAHHEIIQYTKQFII